MVFDDTISSNVSPSRVLDYFIDEGKNPSVILDFLEQHKDDLFDTIKWSDHSPRLISVGFVQNLSLSDAERYVNLLFPLERNESISKELWYLDWAVLLTHHIPVSIKKLFREFYEHQSKTYRLIKHPHVGAIGKNFHGIDTIFANSSHTPEEFAEILNRMDQNTFLLFVKYINHSLYSLRVTQADVISLMDPFRQWFLITSIDASCAKSYHNILTSSIDASVKKSLLKYLINARMVYTTSEIIMHVPYELRESLHSSDSFSKLLMKIQIKGCHRYFDWFLFFKLLQEKNLNSAIKVIKQHKKIFQEFFDITDILEADDDI